MILKERNRNIIKKMFPLFQKFGIHITPNHYYEPIPDTTDLDPTLWERETPLNGINLNLDEQLTFLTRTCHTYKQEYDQLGLDKPTQDCSYYAHNGWYGEIDGDVLYTIIRHYKPKNILEIGRGWSTLLASYALKKNQLENGITGSITTIEPYPNPTFNYTIPFETHQIQKKVQDIKHDYFQILKKNDILFIDSSHIVKINSDVCHEFLEILPQLHKGVIIHFHDIFLPKEYPQDWVLKKKLFWNESYLLQAFLMYNEVFKIIWSGHYMKLHYPDLLSNTFRCNASQSFWIQKTR